MTNSTQLAVIGGGPGGYAAAFLAADLGMQVTLIDEAPDPGGVCLYRGCMPSKALLHVAKVLTEAREALAWGVDFGEPAIDIDRLRAWKDGVVGTLTGGLGQLSTQRGVTYLRGRAELVGPTAARVTAPEGDTTDLQFEHAILATGSRPASPPGLSLESDRVWDSTRALEVPGVPPSLLVVGGGYIGLEIGSVYAALGSAVTVVEMTAGLLPGADRDLTAVVARRLGAVCEAILLETTVATLAEEGDGVRVTLQGPGSSRPNTCSIGCWWRWAGSPTRRFRVSSEPASSVTCGASWSSMGNDGPESRRSSRWATSWVSRCSRTKRVTRPGRPSRRSPGHKTAFEPAAIPAVVFTDPEIAWCGLTEAQARAEGRTVQVCRFPWAASGRAMTLDRPAGVTKAGPGPRLGTDFGSGDRRQRGG